MDSRRLRWVVAIVLVFGIAGLTGIAGAVMGGSFSVQPTSLDFGTIQAGASSQLTVTVTNITGQTLGPINMVGGGVSAPFSAAQNCANATLPPNGSCTIQYTFSPTSPGVFTATSSFTLNGEPFDVVLSGTGAAAAEPVPVLGGYALPFFIGLLALSGVFLLGWRRV